MSEARVAFVTLGCKVNQTESEAVAAALGIAATASGLAEADIVVVNTCTVTGEADRKARKAVRHALGLPLAPVVVVTGCLAALDASTLHELGDRIVVEPDKRRVADRVREVLGTRELAVETSASAPVRARAQLKVEDGCDAFCSYCIVPYARGVPRAVPLEQVMVQAQLLADSGVSEVVLTGINLGRYDDCGAKLPDVLAAVAQTGVPRVRLSSIEPADVTDRLVEVAVATGAFCRHIHVPLQSGSDTVLQRMGRPYDTAGYADVIARSRRAFPGIAITTDVIVGFPGETDEEFAETMAFVERQQFSRLHVFRYSARPGTPAASMLGQVPPSVRAARSEALRALGERLGAEYAASQAGTIAELLVERLVPREGDTPTAEGTTREYLRVTADGAPAHARTGMLLRVLIDPASEGTGARGRIIG